MLCAGGMFHEGQSMTAHPLPCRLMTCLLVEVSGGGLECLSRGRGGGRETSERQAASTPDGAGKTACPCEETPVTAEDACKNLTEFLGRQGRSQCRLPHPPWCSSGCGSRCCLLDGRPPQPSPEPPAVSRRAGVSEAQGAKAALVCLITPGLEHTHMQVHMHIVPRPPPDPPGTTVPLGGDCQQMTVPPHPRGGTDTAQQ